MNILNHTYMQAQQATEKLERVKDISFKNTEMLEREQAKYQELTKKFHEIFDGVDLSQMKEMLLFAKNHTKNGSITPTKAPTKIQKDLLVKKEKVTGRLKQAKLDLSEVKIQ